MILNNAPQNEAIVSNVAEIGEFRIRNSAKAFSILSSGLYSNKIKAIVRELSCNAVDSHAAAGKSSIPFSVHLPNSFEPWFSIRDYGVGLNHEEVTNIYTTYFESTKTSSNEFIGALGLGSKSPFSYTDNFTVTSIKDGRKGIYSAFINDAGVPSIALMCEEETDEETGVEVKFSVEESHDFYKFADEASAVYKWFKVKPSVIGNDSFRFIENNYETEDLIPGVHVAKTNNHYVVTSYAVMGNIAYPIKVPNETTSLGGLHEMLGCGLVMEFAIGELDFSASREDLSYIPSTIAAIKKKLEEVRDHLYVHIETAANQIDNLWTRGAYISEKLSQKLWKESATKYVINTDLKTVDIKRYSHIAELSFEVEQLAKLFNISIKAFSKNRNHSTMSTIKPSPYRAPGSTSHVYKHEIDVLDSTLFVINDTKIGALERAKNYFRSAHQPQYSINVYVLSKEDSSKEMKTKEFFDALMNPPEKQIFKASAFPAKERQKSSVGANVSILYLTERDRGYYSGPTVVWADAGKLDDFDDNENVYYVPLTGYKMISEYDLDEAKTLHRWIRNSGIKSLSDIVIHGVRKSDLDAVKNKSNWINIEQHVIDSISQIDKEVIVASAIKKVSLRQANFIIKDAIPLVNPNSPYVKLANAINKTKSYTFESSSLESLFKKYGKSASFDFSKEVEDAVTEIKETTRRYKIFDHCSWIPSDVAAEYINMVDTAKGI